MSTEAIPEESEGIGAAKRRKKPPVKAEPVKAKSAKDVVKSGPKNDHVGANGTDSSTTFKLDYTDQRGYHWTGDFKSHVLTIGERTSVGLTRSRMSGGMSLDGIDEATLSLMEMQAHLAIALDEYPEWAEDISTIRDIGVLTAIYSEVASHEAMFWNPGAEGVRKVEVGEG